MSGSFWILIENDQETSNPWRRETSNSKIPDWLQTPCNHRYAQVKWLLKIIDLQKNAGNMLEVWVPKKICIYIYMYLYIYMYIYIYITILDPKSTGVAEFGGENFEPPNFSAPPFLFKAPKKHHEMPKQMPSREPTYPSLGKGKSSTQKCWLVEDMLVPGRVTHGVQTWKK